MHFTNDKTTATMYVTYSIMPLPSGFGYAAPVASRRRDWRRRQPDRSGGGGGLVHFDSSWNTIIMMSPLFCCSTYPAIPACIIRLYYIKTEIGELFMALYQENYCNYFGDSWGVSIQIAAHAVLIQLTAAAAASATVQDAWLAGIDRVQPRRSVVNSLLGNWLFLSD